LLAVIDVNANLYVYHVDKECNVTKYLNIIRKENSVPFGVTPRISWCPFIPEPDDSHEDLHMIAVYFVREHGGSDIVECDKIRVAVRGSHFRDVHGSERCRDKTAH
uniref:Nucleoporin_N domain-containing protein n=1 Tax=Gongylonema pulchrum TaxID=637853 RepID=A0A183D4R9_9BILA